MAAKRRKLAYKSRKIRHRTVNTDARIALVGLGGRGNKTADGLVRMGYRLVGACDIDRERLERFAADYPDTRCTTSLEELAALAPDVTVVATLAPQRVGVVERLAAAGVRKLLCEKPIAASMADVARVRQLAREHGLEIAVNHVRLWAPDYPEIRDWIAKDPPGDLERVDVRFKPKGFGTNACHYLTAVSLLLDRKIKGVREARFDPGDPVERPGNSSDDLNGRAVYDLDGVEMCVDNLSATPNPRPRFSFFFERGRVEIFEASETWLVADARRGIEREEPLRDPWRGSSLPDVAAQYLDRAVSDVIAARTERYLEYACDAVEATIGAQLAWKRGGAVTFPLAVDDPTPIPFF